MSACQCLFHRRQHQMAVMALADEGGDYLAGRAILTGSQMLDIHLPDASFPLPRFYRFHLCYAPRVS